MRNIYLTFIALLYFANLFAQHGDYDNTSKWFLGLNAGATWNSTDVKSKTASSAQFALGAQVSGFQLPGLACKFGSPFREQCPFALKSVSN